MLPGGDFRGAVVLPCTDLDGTLRFFMEQLGFRLQTIFPADEPRVAVISVEGLRVVLDRAHHGAPGELQLECPDRVEPGELIAPNGTRVVLTAPGRAGAVRRPVPRFTLLRAEDEGAWTEGRAGMLYRDLVPGRQGGLFAASHIRIAAGGPVPDYVHHHDVRAQMIFCRRGWVRVVYQHQGEPFVLEPGDCVLQPPGIRHRVLESSPGLEVIELASPAEHPTHTDPERELPDVPDPGHVSGGQRFVRHVANDSTWTAEAAGLEARDTGIDAATGGLLGVRVLRSFGPTASRSSLDVYRFLFVLEGALRLERGDGDVELVDGDAVTLPPGDGHALAGDGFELLEATLRSE